AAETVAQSAGNSRAQRAPSQQAPRGDFGFDLRPVEMPAQKDDCAVDDGRIETEQESAQRRDRRNAVRIAKSSRLGFGHRLDTHTPTFRPGSSKGPANGEDVFRFLPE